MNAFKRLSILQCTSDIGDPRIQVVWALDRAFKAPGPYAFELWRLRGPTDPQAILVSQGGDGHWIYDEQPIRSEHGTETYYQVVLIDAAGDRHESQVAQMQSYWNAVDWRIARAVTRAEAKLMRKRAGTFGYLLKRRYWGAPCPDCVDPITGQVDDPNCSTCYGTAFLEGYHAPIPMWLTIEGAGKVGTLNDQAGHVQGTTLAVRALAYPPIEPSDIWVQVGPDTRYLVGAQVEPVAMHRGIPLVLKTQISELPRSNAVYRVPLPECQTP